MKHVKDVLTFLLFILAAGCAGMDQENGSERGAREQEAIETSSNKADEINVELINREGVKTGTAILTESDKGVKIAIKAFHLSPGGHGFHIHEKGQCTPPDFKSAGGHFNPEGKEHGTKNPKGPHAGDLPNINVKNDGTVQEVITNDRVTLQKGKQHSLLKQEGTALMIHSDPDDYKTDPAGDAGERIACGVIREHTGEKHS